MFGLNHLQHIGSGTLGSWAIPEIEYHRALKVEQALELLSQFERLNEKCAIVAGGTDLIPHIRQGKMPAAVHVIDISAVDELNYVVKDGTLIRIGAATKLSEIETSNLIGQDVPLLRHAVNQLGSLQIRSAGTIGGNLCNASPAADTAPPLLALGTELEVRSINGERTIPLTEFFLGPGRTALQSDEILAEIRIPMHERSATGSRFIKLGRRNSFTLSVVSVATLVKLKNGLFDDIRIAVGSVAPTPIRASKAEGCLVGRKVSIQAVEEAAKIVGSEVKPISDVRASAEYRKDMSSILTKRALTSSVAEAADS